MICCKNVKDVAILKIYLYFKKLKKKKENEGKKWDLKKGYIMACDSSATAILVISTIVAACGAFT